MRKGDLHLRRGFHLLVILVIVMGVRECGGPLQAEDRFYAGSRWIAEKVGVNGAREAWIKNVSPSIAAANRWMSRRTYGGVSWVLQGAGSAAETGRSWIVEGPPTKAVRSALESVVTPSETPQSAAPASAPPIEKDDAGVR